MSERRGVRAYRLPMPPAVTVVIPYLLCDGRDKIYDV